MRKGAQFFASETAVLVGVQLAEACILLDLDVLYAILPRHSRCDWSGQDNTRSGPSQCSVQCMNSYSFRFHPVGARRPAPLLNAMDVPEQESADGTATCDESVRNSLGILSSAGDEATEQPDKCLKKKGFACRRLATPLTSDAPRRKRLRQAAGPCALNSLGSSECLSRSL